jgi:hypothetical protein
MGQIGCGVKLITHVYPEPRLRMEGALPLPCRVLYFNGDLFLWTATVS